MAVPKRKTSKSRRDKRRASTWKVEAPAMSECPQCHEIKLPHRVCKNCGYYDGKPVIVMEKDAKEAKAAAKEDKKAAKLAAKENKAIAKKAKSVKTEVVDADDETAADEEVEAVADDAAVQTSEDKAAE